MPQSPPISLYDTMPLPLRKRRRLLLYRNVAGSILQQEWRSQLPIGDLQTGAIGAEWILGRGDIIRRSGIRPR